MKKIAVFAGIIMLSYGVAQAKVRSIVEWDGGENPYKPGNISVTGEKIESKCSTSCKGYSLTITTCSGSQKLVHCETAGCGYYNKCVPLTADEKNKYRPDPLDSVDVDDIYNQIIKEQEAQKEANSNLGF